MRTSLFCLNLKFIKKLFVYELLPDIQYFRPVLWSENQIVDAFGVKRKILKIVGDLMVSF